MQGRFCYDEFTNNMYNKFMLQLKKRYDLPGNPYTV